MEDHVLGLHHVTAIAGNPQRNHDFYTKVLGLRLVKKTVNFDDPKTYHFYFGDSVGTPGTILTFFPWPRVKDGRPGTGMATEIGYSIPEGSLEFWRNRLAYYHIEYGEIQEKFGEKFFLMKDPDGLRLELCTANKKDKRQAWETEEIKSDTALRGFHYVSLTVRDMAATGKVLTEQLGYRLQEQDGNRYRFVTDAIETANLIDILEAPESVSGLNAGGTNHHVAFRVSNVKILEELRERIAEAGYQITPVRDRKYFKSVYFREPGGVLFELATDNPGFLIDENVEELGSSLKLPSQFESQRKHIEYRLPKLKH